MGGAEINGMGERKILIVEDDLKTSRLIATYLEREGFTTEAAYDGTVAIEAVRRREFVFVILDMMLPGADGWEVCRFIRSMSQTPVLFLTARDEEIDRVTGLELGADDYVVKPFSPRELVARVKAILRRTRSSSLPLSNSPTDGELTCNDLALVPEKHEITLHGREVQATGSEFTLLHALMSAPGRVFSRRELLDRLYPDGELVVDRVVDVHIGKLRRKLESDPSQPHYIRTVRGVGYQLIEHVGDL